MKNRIYLIISMFLAAALVLTGCSGGGEAASGELTFKQAFERPGVHVWYDVVSPSDGRLAKVRSAFVVEDGKVTVYDATNIDDNIPNALGTLEDYCDLSEEEAAALVREKYRSGYEAYYALLEDNMAYYKDLLEEYSNWDEAEEQMKALQETHDALTGQPMPEKEPQSFSFAMELDQTGNEAAAEGIHAIEQYDRQYEGHIDNTKEGHKLYSVVEGQEIDMYFPVQTPLKNIEVYDTWYGGYSADYYELFGRSEIHCMITKCEEDTVFTLDPAGTEGIEIIN